MKAQRGERQAGRAKREEGAKRPTPSVKRAASGASHVFECHNGCFNDDGKRVSFEVAANNRVKAVCAKKPPGLSPQWNIVNTDRYDLSTDWRTYWMEVAAGDTKVNFCVAGNYVATIADWFPFNPVHIIAAQVQKLVTIDGERSLHLDYFQHLIC